MASYAMAHLKQITPEVLVKNYAHNILERLEASARPGDVEKCVIVEETEPEIAPPEEEIIISASMVGKMWFCVRCCSAYIQSR